MLQGKNREKFCFTVDEVLLELEFCIMITQINNDWYWADDTLLHRLIQKKRVN